MGSGQSSSSPTSASVTEPSTAKVAPDVKNPLEERPAEDFGVSPPPLTAAKPKEDTIENPGEFEEIGKRAKGSYVKCQLTLGLPGYGVGGSAQSV